MLASAYLWSVWEGTQRQGYADMVPPKEEKESFNSVPMLYSFLVNDKQEPENFVAAARWYAVPKC